MNRAAALALVSDLRAQAISRWEAASGGGSLCRVDLPPAERERLKSAEGAAYALGDLVRALRSRPDATSTEVLADSVHGWSEQNPTGRGATFDAYRAGGLAALDDVSRRLGG